MAYTFIQSPLVVSSSVIAASSMSRMADAVNSRLLSGLGDFSKRIHQYCFHLFRQIRNPDAEGNFPSLGEFPMYYQHLDFDSLPATYPDAGAGEFEGANLANPAAQFVFGVGSIQGEGDRLSEYAIFSAGGDTVENLWNLGKNQRGGYDIDTGAINAPMLGLARTHFAFSYPDNLRYNKSPGGYLPTPRLLFNNPCHTTDDNGNETYWNNYEYSFQSLANPLTIYTYTGTCGPDAGGSETDVSGIAEYPWAWYVYQFNGNTTVFRKNEYRIRLTGGGIPSRENGDQFGRLMVNPFIHDFRGTEQQRTQTCFDTPYISYAFDFQNFFVNQYQLAPAYATQSGESIDIGYPSWTVTTTQASGSSLAPYSIHSGYRISSHFIKHSGLNNNVVVQLLSGSTILKTTTINKNTGSFIETFGLGPTQGDVTYRFATTCSFSNASGYLFIEQAELYDYKPEVWDAYALIRMASARGGLPDSEMDDRGIDADYARQIYDDYTTYGMMKNVHGAGSVNNQVAAINTNPVFDSARKFVNSFTRTINGLDMRLTSRPLLTGYEVSASRSILYFQRFQTGLGLETNNMDMFAGMVNSTNSASNGMINTASPRGYTNEWILELCGKPYDPSDSSIWKKETYADYYPYINRCHILPPDRECGKTSNEYLFRFFQDAPAVLDYRNKLYFPESLTAYNYDGTTYRIINQKAYDEIGDESSQIAKHFYLSCQVYPKPYEISELKVIENDIVKITLDRRLQYSGSAVTTISSDVSTWNFEDIKNEGYRTDENIVRLFLLKQYNNANNPTSTIGDHAVNSELQFDSNDPYASIYPTFFFTKLIPRPYTNDGIMSTGSLDNSGSLPRAYDLQMVETYIRAACEGFVDESVSVDDACNTDFNTDFDYTFANLCYDAFGRNWISNITGSQRSDYPQTYGPLPTMTLNTQVFNQLSQCINKLTKVRLPLPYTVLVRKKTYQDTYDVTPTWPIGAECSTLNSKAIVYDFDLTTPTTLVNTSDWMNANGGFTVGHSVAPTCGNGNVFQIVVTKEVAELAFDTTDPLAWNAVNEDLRALASGSGLSSAKIFTRDVTREYAVSVGTSATPPDESCGIDSFWQDGGSYFVNETNSETTNSECTYHAGSIDIQPSDLQTSDLMIGWRKAQGLFQQSCHYLPYASKEVTVRNTQHMIIDVPTVS